MLAAAAPAAGGTSRSAERVQVCERLVGGRCDEGGYADGAHVGEASVQRHRLFIGLASVHGVPQGAARHSMPVRFATNCSVRNRELD